MSEPYELYQLLFPNGKRYIGISVNSKSRWRQHQDATRKGSKLPVHRAIRKFGWSSVDARILCVGDKDYIKDLEIRLIAAHGADVKDDGYNVSPGGDISPMKVEASRLKMQQSMLRRFQDPAKVEQNREAQRKARARPEVAAKFTGRVLSEQARANMSAAQKGRKQPRTPEWQKKLDDARRGQKRSEESRAKMSAGQQRRVRTPEELARLATDSKRYSNSPEGRAKRAEAGRISAQKRWGPKT